MPRIDEGLQPLPVPDDRDWATIGVRLGAELHAGHQSRVFRAELAGDAVVVKLTDGRLADRSFPGRVDLMTRLAASNESVVGPVRIGTELVTSLGEWFVVAFPFVTGVAPDLGERDDVVEMAAALATLHDSLRALGPTDLPPVAALRDDVQPVDAIAPGTTQLLHGDYSHKNTLFDDDGDLRIYDFDDCGYGPIEFEVGNSLYMVLFDAAMTNDHRRYERFREWFVGAYNEAARLSLTDSVLDAAIRVRVDALGRWIDDPRDAPIGIRTASPAWRRTLRSFAESQRCHDRRRQVGDVGLWP